LKNANLDIANLALTPRRAWQITTTEGMVVELGRVEMQRRLDKFVSAYGSTIAGLNMKVTYVDLRYPNGFAVRRPAEAKPLSEDKNSAKATGVSKIGGISKVGGIGRANENKLNSNNPAGTLKPGNKKPAEINKQQT
ncbi:MAG: cell division protein FtsQ/DivIB, partial [Methylotenera sp.]|nr:cell division protein FtsQ/DivIB [Methylotenera sp.]